MNTCILCNKEVEAEQGQIPVFWDNNGSEPIESDLEWVCLECESGGNNISENCEVCGEGLFINPDESKWFNTTVALGDEGEPIYPYTLYENTPFVCDAHIVQWLAAHGDKHKVNFAANWSLRELQKDSSDMRVIDGLEYYKMPYEFKTFIHRPCDGYIWAIERDDSLFEAGRYDNN